MAVRRYGLAASPASPRLPRTTRLGASHLPWLAAQVGIQIVGSQIHDQNRVARQIREPVMQCAQESRL